MEDYCVATHVGLAVLRWACASLGWRTASIVDLNCANHAGREHDARCSLWLNRTRLARRHLVRWLLGIEQNANSLFFAPNDVTIASEVIRGDYEIKCRRNANLVRDLKGGTGVRKISNEAIDTRAVKRDRSSFQNTPTEPNSFVVHGTLFHSLLGLVLDVYPRPPRALRDREDRAR